MYIFNVSIDIKADFIYVILYYSIPGASVAIEADEE